MKQRDESIGYIRVFAMVLVLACHICTRYGWSFFASVFLFGVEIFFFVSGFLAFKKDRKPDSKWIVSRFKRIFVPVLLFSAILAFVAAVSGSGSRIPDMFSCSFGLYGLNKLIPGFSFDGFPGMTHLWFVTIIMISYLLTPLFYWVTEEKKRGNLFLAGLIALQVALSLFGIRISYIVVYYIGYWSRHADFKVDTARKYVLLNLGCIFTLALRVAANVLFDDTWFYLQFVIPVNDAMLAITAIYDIKGILGLVEGKIGRYPLSGVFAWLDRISYEVYIVHYTFIDGIMDTFRFESDILNVAAFLTVSIVSAFLLHMLTDAVYRGFGRIGKTADCR